MTRFRLKSIGSKILVRTILVVLLPLVALSAIVLVGLDQLGQAADEQVAESRAQLSRESVAVNAQDQAVSIAREINATLLERVADVTSWTRNQTVIDGAIAGNELAEELNLSRRPVADLEDDYDVRKSTGVAPAAERFLVSEIEAAPDFAEVFFTDANGFNAGLTNLTSDFVQSDEDWWQEAWAEGISISDVEFDESSNTFSVDVSARIDDPTSGERLGVMKASLSVAFVQSVTTARSIGNTDYTVALPDGRLIAETSTFHSNDRLMTELPDDELPDGIREALEQGGAGALVTDETVFGYTRTSAANFLGDDIRGFKGFDWIVVSSQRADLAFAPLRGLQTLSDEIDDAGAALRGSVILAVVIAAVIAVVISRLLARSIVNPIRGLTAAASNAADTGLPNAVVQIDQAGGDLDSVEVPEINLDTGDELEQLASSFNSVQGTAVRLAAEQALGRRNTADMFVNLGRRNNSLLKRQLRFIDGLERNEADPETLESLYKLDHLATRMRRNAESLLVLAGDRSPRRWTARVPMIDAAKAALAEVEEFERVSIDQVGPGTLQGNVVADFAHILAELIENALTFSPPQTNVVLNGRQNKDESYTVTITDEGIGMQDDELAAANDRLATAFDLSRVPAQHIGLFVVGRLARQHGIDVTLSASPSGGTTATVKLPATIASENNDEVPQPSDSGSVAEAEADTATQATSDDDGASASDQRQVDEARAQQLPTRRSQAQQAPDETVSPTEEAEQQTEESSSVEKLPASQRRADDSPNSPEAVDRRGPDDPPNESVTLGDIEVPRRRKAGAAPAADVSPEPVDAVDGDETDPKLGEYGFTRRRRGADASTSTGQPAMVAKVGADDDAEATAEQSRSQWSSFQRGKETAESEPSKSTESVSPDEQGA